MLACRVDLSTNCEQMVNQQIQHELQAAQTYLAMHAYCNRMGVALPGFASFFLKCAEEERQHAQQWIDYLNERGGSVQIGALSPPTCDYEHVKDAIAAAYAKEVELHEHLVAIHDQADAHLQDFIEGQFLTEQVKAEKELSDLHVNLKRSTDLFFFDKMYWK